VAQSIGEEAFNTKIETIYGACPAGDANRLRAWVERVDADVKTLNPRRRAVRRSLMMRREAGS